VRACSAGAEAPASRRYAVQLHWRQCPWESLYKGWPRSAFLKRGAAKSASGEYDGECLLYHLLSVAMAQSSTKRSAAQGERASGGVQGQPTHLVWSLALGFDQGRSRAHEPQQRGITKRDDRASAIAILYQTCKTWRTQLSDDGFCMRTFSLCRALSDGKGQTLQRMQATIGRQLEQTSDKDVTDQAWWLDARSLVQRCNFLVGSGKVWSWLQAASQEPDGPLSRQAAATARMLGWHLVCWPDKPQVRFPGLCTLRGHSAPVNSVAFSPDGTRVVSASGDYGGGRDNTVRIWDVASGKEVGASGPGHARY
jgi:WD40 repeat protein